MSQESEITVAATNERLSNDSETQINDIDAPLPSVVVDGDVDRYRPAYELLDGSLERAGRGPLPSGKNNSGQAT